MTVRRPLVLVNGRIAELPLTDTTDGSDLHYSHDQGVPSAEWIVTHSLSKYPAVTVIDSAGSVMEGDVSYIDINSVSIKFSAAFSGKAIFN